MTKVITSHKKFLIYITTLILWAIPLVMDVPSGTYEIIWLIYLIPPILITFHHTIKIDRTFVQDIALEPRDKAMLESMLVMAKNLNFDTIAEGVETKEQLERNIHIVNLKSTRKEA